VQALQCRFWGAAKRGYRLMMRCGGAALCPVSWPLTMGPVHYHFLGTR
jgi:hypothetical protein